MQRVPHDQPRLVEELLTRIDALRSHASALDQAFRSEALKVEARDLIATLRMAEDALRRAPDAQAISAIKQALDAASVRLSGLGRVE